MPTFEDYLSEFQIMIKTRDHSPEEQESMAKLIQMQHQMPPLELRKLYQYFGAMIEQAIPKDPTTRMLS